MKMELPEIEVSRGTEVNGDTFSIDSDDMHIIISWLRDKIYPNPIRAICREILSNGKDAHIENKIPNVPITVHIPTGFEPWWSVQDNGIGISPARMKTIFLKYGKSSKRDSNEQLGGYGLGAKSPFSYTDAFVIETMTPESHWENKGVIHENCMVRRVYTAYIDETRMGRIDLNFAEVTTKPQGTTIKVPVKPNDYEEFVRFTEIYTRYWDVRPILENGTIDWEEIKAPFAGKDWVVNKKLNGYTVILDGIPYPLRQDMLKINKDDFEDVFNIGGLIKMRTGQLDVTIGREDLDYTEKTQDALVTKLTDICKELIDSMRVDIESSATYIEACQKFKEIKGTLFKLDNTPIYWKGLLVKTAIKRDSDDYDIEVLQFQTKGKRGTESWSNSHITEFESSEFLFMHKECNKFNARVITLLDNNKTPLMIKFRTEDPAKIAALREKYHLDHLNIQDIETVEPFKFTNEGSGTIHYGDIRCFSRKGYRPSYKNYFCNTPDPSSIPLKAVYVILHDRMSFMSNDKLISFSNLEWVLAHLKVPIYGVVARSIAKVPKAWIPLDKFLLSVHESLKPSMVETYDQDYRIDKQYHIGEALMKSERAIKNPNGLAARYIHASNEFAKIEAKPLTPQKANMDKVRRIQMIMNLPDETSEMIYSLQKIHNAFHAKYPLVRAWSYEMGSSKQELSYLINYINQKDYNTK